jgi:L-amino acid N-acyltransferase YncA
MTGRSAPKPVTPIVRDSEDGNLAAIAAIYGHHVMHGFGSFEEVPPGVDELARRRREILDKGLPYLIASDGDGAVLGYAYASPYRTRSAYRFTVEDSIYVAPEAARRGVGRLLLQALIERCTRLGYRQMIAVIGDSGNDGSIGVHQSLGFVRAALLPTVGFKRGRWIDCVMMQRALGPGADVPPVEIAKP